MGEVTGRYSNFLEESGLGRVRVCYQVEWQYIAALDMKSQSHIEKLAEQKLASAYCLLDKGQYNDAYYLAGYAVELYLKAMVCKTLRVDDFFNFDKAPKEIYRPYKNHNYKNLVLLSGMQTEFSAASKDANFIKNWTVVNKWTEQSRYKGDQDPEAVKEFVHSTKEFCIWIKKH